MSKDIEEIGTLLHSYQDALSNASAEDTVKFYTNDGVCMAQHLQSAVGIDNVRRTYEGLFSITKFNVEFEIQEIVPVAPDWAFARVNTSGKTDIQGKGLSNNTMQELFVFQKTGGEWKIARYSFSTTNPPSS